MNQADTLLKEYEQTMLDHWKWLHAHPELSGQEKNTAAYVADQLRNMGLEPQENVGGYGDGRFGPDDAVTIEQVAVILWNYSGNPTFTASADSVGKHSVWAANALGWAVENKILENLPYESVTGNASRAQTAQMLMNYLRR